MNYIIKPTLEHRALVEIVISLWNCSSVRRSIDEFHDLVPSRECYQDDVSLFDRPTHKKEWQRIENVVLENVPHLVLPESLKKKILHLIKPMGLQILHWIEYLKFCNIDVIMLNNLCWKQQGTVDRKRTAEVLVNDDSLDVTIRYQLACINCLKDDILQLWNKLPANWLESSYKSEGYKDLTVFWTYDIKGEISRMNNRIPGALYHPHSPYQFAFEWAALSGNKVATEYFFRKLTHEEKEESLVKTATKVASEGCELYFGYDDIIDYPTNGRAEVLCFLLSQMDDDQQLQVYRNSPYGVLRCLLDWPWQHFFMEAANHMWEFMSDSCFYRTLKIIAGKAFFSYKGHCYYQELFTEFWQHGITTHKKYVVHECETTGHLLTILFLVEDKENIRLIMKQATDEEKERIVFLGVGMGICEDLIYEDKWDWLTFVVEQCISSTNMRIKFKKEVEEHVMHNCPEELLKNKPNMCKKLRCILDDLIYNDDKKRSMEEGETSSTTRKFCNTQ